MSLYPVDIKTKKFTKAMRGYDADEVKTFLENIAAEIEELVSENDNLKEEIEELKASINDYRKKEEDLQNALHKAQDSSETSIDSVRKQANLIMKEAELKASKIVDRAKENANEIRNAVINLREEKDLIISKLKAIVNSQSNLLEGKVKPADEEPQELKKPDVNNSKDDFDVDVDDIVNKLL
jgi:cell division initiation protein